MLNEANLKGVEFGGLINEDVMQQIFDVSRIPLPFTDLVGTAGGISQSYTEWTVDRLADPNVNNAIADGADTINNDDTATGKRVGNHCQISTKTVTVSTRADESDTIAYARELARQVMRRQQELRRDVEAIVQQNQASLADAGDGVTGGRVGGFYAWLETHYPGSWTGTPGGFASGTVSAFTPAAGPVTGSESMLKEVINKVWGGGGSPRVIMSVPSVIEKLSEYMFSNSAKIATLQGNTSADAGTAQLTAKASVNVYVADHGQVVEFQPNRLQQLEGGRANLGVIDPEYVGIGYLHGYRTEPLAKTGLAEKRQMAVDYSLKVLNEEAHGMLPDLDPTADWVG